jgi:tungsten cofactor oxidoreducase radical SAM maturase
MPLNKIYLELTNKCNMECSFCYRNSWDEKLNDMNSELFTKIKKDIDDIRSVKSIVLGGIGEPTIAPIIAEAIAELKKYKITLTTNALTINNSLMNLIVENTHMVMISIDGLHDSYLRIRKAFLNDVIENVDKINDLKRLRNKNTPYVGIQYVVSKDNIHDIFDIIDLAGRLNAHILVISNLIPQTSENHDKILYTRYENKDMALLFKKVLSYSSRKGVNILFPNYELKTERRCSFIDDDATFITASGEVVPCYRMSHTYTEYVFGRKKTVLKHSFGNVGNENLNSIWENRGYANFRDMVRNNRYPSCIDCDLVEGCDMVKDTSTECYAGSPSCADCLWARKITFCP